MVRWIRVHVVDDGSISSLSRGNEQVHALIYTASWTCENGDERFGRFCPTLGELKPDEARVRRLIALEGLDVQ